MRDYAGLVHEYQQLLDRVREKPAGMSEGDSGELERLNTVQHNIMQDHEDARRCERVPFNRSIYYDSTTGYVKGCGVDIGYGGMRIQTSERLPLETVIEIAIPAFQYHHFYRFDARVIWCTQVQVAADDPPKPEQGDLFEVGLTFEQARSVRPSLFQ